MVTRSLVRPSQLTSPRILLMFSTKSLCCHHMEPITVAAAQSRASLLHASAPMGAGLTPPLPPRYLKSSAGLAFPTPAPPCPFPAQSSTVEPSFLTCPVTAAPRGDTGYPQHPAGGEQGGKVLESGWCAAGLNTDTSSRGSNTPDHVWFTEEPLTQS